MNEQIITYAENQQTISPTKAVSRRHNAIKTDWWERGILSFLIPVLMAFLDFIVVKLIIDKACLQQEWLSYAYAFGLALALNFLPSQFVKSVFYERYRLRTDAKAWAIITLAAFALLYFTMLYVRFCYFDMYLPDSGTGGVVNTIGAAAAETSSGTDGVRKAVSMTLLTGISPLVTSIICGAISYFTANPMKAMLQERELRRQELLSELHRVELALASYERDAEELINLDNGRYETARQAIHDRCAALHAKALLALEEYIGRADATSKISAEAIQKAKDADMSLPTPTELPNPKRKKVTALVSNDGMEASVALSESRLSA